MLEKAIEIEGLLRIIRDGDPLPETYILLNTKTAELAEMAENLKEKSSAPEPESPHADFVMATQETSVKSIPEVVFTLQETTPGEHSLGNPLDTTADIGVEMNGISAEDLALTEEDDIVLYFEDSSDFSLPDSQAKEIHDNLQVATNPQSDTSESIDNENYSSSMEKEMDSGDNDTNYPDESLEESDEKSEETKESGEPEAEKELPDLNDVAEEHFEPVPSTPVLENDSPATSVRKIKLRSAFSLNDRFLYARELFNGNMKMFDSTLDFLEGIEDYSIIEDYFYSELEWNPEDSNVAAFMEILRPHFNE